MKTITLIRKERKGPEHYTNSQTNKTVYPYNYITKDSLPVGESVIKQLKDMDEEAIEEIKDFMEEKNYEPGEYEIRVAHGGVPRFKKGKGFERILSFKF